MNLPTSVGTDWARPIAAFFVAGGDKGEGAIHLVGAEADWA